MAEFIAGAYFYLYKRRLTQLNYCYDKLASIQNTMLAIKLCATLPEPQATAAKERLIEVLMTTGEVFTPAVLQPNSGGSGRQSASPASANPPSSTHPSETSQ